MKGLTMNRSRTLAIAVALTASVATIPFVASAQIVNPDNDSGTFFRDNVRLTVKARGAAALPAIGSLSPDGQYVYSGSDRGWIARVHSYVIQQGALVHTEDCLPYMQPAPVAAFAVPSQYGAFGEHGV
jgi:hypothetical protein